MRKGLLPRLAALISSALLASGAGCSIKKLAINKLGDALAESGSSYSSDEDPELIRGALPFSLKLIESLLEQSPRHQGLLTAAAGGFVQYTYAFIQQDADEIEDRDLEAATALRARAKKLHLRALRYALRGLDVAYPGFETALRAEPGSALSRTGVRDVPLLYWTAAAWGSAISLAKDDPELLADLSLVGTILKRALALDESYDSGAIHDFLITYEGGRSAAMGGSEKRAREHFERAIVLSQGKRASPCLSLAESVSIGRQDRAEFEALLNRALAVDPDAVPEWRLANLVMQRRAKWLLGRAGELFVE